MTTGDTFLLPGEDDRLRLVISGPDPVGRVVVVCLLSYQTRYDQACLLEAGDHPFIKHTTCVQYVTARLVPAVTLERKQQDGSLRMKAPLTRELLSRIQSSAANGDISTECYSVLRIQ